MTTQTVVYKRKSTELKMFNCSRILVLNIIGSQFNLLPKKWTFVGIRDIRSAENLIKIFCTPDISGSANVHLKHNINNKHRNHKEITR